jgi:hypothetical protein
MSGDNHDHAKAEQQRKLIAQMADEIHAKASLDMKYVTKRVLFWTVAVLVVLLAASILTGCAVPNPSWGGSRW